MNRIYETRCLLFQEFSVPWIRRNFSYVPSNVLIIDLYAFLALLHDIVQP